MAHLLELVVEALKHVLLLFSSTSNLLVSNIVYLVFNGGDLLFELLLNAIVKPLLV